MSLRPVTSALRRPVLAAALSAVSLALAACGSPNASPQRPTGRILTIDEQTLSRGGADTVRLGRLHEGEIAELPLRLKNGSSRPLLLAEYDRSCGCTTLSFENRPIRPDSTAALQLRFDTRGEWGWQLKLLRLYFAGAAEPFRLYVEAEIDGGSERASFGPR